MHGRGPEIGSCSRGHQWTADNTYVTPRGTKECRACRQLRYRPGAKRYHSEATWCAERRAASTATEFLDNLSKSELIDRVIVLEGIFAEKHSDLTKLPIPLSPQQIEIMSVFMAKPNVWLKTDMICDACGREESWVHSLKVQIKKIRERLKPFAVTIDSSHSSGFRLSHENKKRLDAACSAGGDMPVAVANKERSKPTGSHLRRCIRCDETFRGSARSTECADCAYRAEEVMRA